MCGSARASDVPDALTFAPIDVLRDRETYTAFGRDLMAISYGPYRFALQFGSDGLRYVEWIAQRQLEGSECAQFALLGNQPVGMFVVSRSEVDLSTGYINSLYLAPAFRRQGLGQGLEAAALRVLSAKGFQRARLSVAVANEPAVGFYDQQGWHLVGQRQGSPEAVYLEKKLPPI